MDIVKEHLSYASFTFNLINPYIKKLHIRKEYDSYEEYRKTKL
jgi:hypothetical protein